MNLKLNMIDDLKYYFPFIYKFINKKQIYEYLLYSFFLPIIETIKFLYQLSILKYLADNYFSNEKTTIFGYEVNLPMINFFQNQILNLISITLVIWTISILMQWRMNLLQHVNQNTIIEEMRSYTYQFLIKLKIDLFNKIETGTMQSIWMMIRHVGGFFEIIITSIKNILLAIVILILIFEFFRFGILYFGFLLFILILINYFFSYKIHIKSLLASRLNTLSMGRLDELIYAAKLIKISQISEKEIKSFNQLHDKIKQNNISLSVFKNISKLILQFLATLTILCLIIFIDYNKIPLLDIFAFGILATRLSPVVVELIKSINYFFELTGILSNLKSILLENKIDSLKISKKNTIKEINHIQLVNVSFSYGRNEVFKNANIRLEKSKTYCLLGSSGSGKSTLLDVISGFNQPTTGQLLVNKHINLNRNNSESYMNLISYLPQESIILNKSILQNILFTQKNKKINKKIIDESIKFAELTDLVNILDGGINFRVGARGNFLSGGQKQRIAIARAINKKFELLIFDEATSNIDAITEYKIISKLLKKTKNAISIFATHRQNIIKFFDSIIVIHNSKIYQFDSLKEFKKREPEIYKYTIPN